MRTRAMASSFTAAAFFVAAFLVSASGAQSPASLSVEPKEQVVLLRKPVRLMCRTGVSIVYCRMESPTGDSWFLSPMTNDSNPNHPIYDGSGYESGQCGMLLRETTDNDNGLWKCTMAPSPRSGSSMEIKGSATITVARAPVQPQLDLSPSLSPTGSSGRYDFVQGDTVRATCRVLNGRPPANITWFIDNQTVSDGLSNVEYTNGTVAGTWTVSQNLTRVVKWEDNGKYLRCVSQHIAQTANANNQSSVMLSVRYAPQPHLTPIEMFGFEVGQEGIITVPIQANPLPSLVWDIDGTKIQGGSTDPENHYQASTPNNMGTGKWEATLRITRVEEADIQRHYILTATNEFGSETYKIALSTSSEPTVMELGAGAIIGIVVAILFVLLLIFLVIFARATGRWCFKGGVSSSRNDIRESSDTESADRGPTSKTRRPKMNLSYIFNKKKDKVSDEPPETPKLEPEAISSEAPLQQKTNRGDIVYAELDLKDLAGKPRPQVRPEEDKTEYAEIVYTTKAKEPETQEK